jgi:hypothetical protein
VLDLLSAKLIPRRHDVAREGASRIAGASFRQLDRTQL